MFLLKRKSSSKHNRASSWGSLLDRPKMSTPPAPVPEIPRLDKEPPCIPELGLLGRRNSLGELGAKETLSEESSSPPRSSTPAAPRPSTPARPSTPTMAARASPRPSTPTARPCTPARTGSSEKTPLSTPHYQKVRPAESPPSSRHLSSPPPRRSSPPSRPSSRAAALRKSLLPPRKASRITSSPLPETPQRFKDSISAPTPVPGWTPKVASTDLFNSSSPPSSRRPSLPKAEEVVRPPDRKPDKPARAESSTLPAPTSRRPPPPSYDCPDLSRPRTPRQSIDEYRLPSASPTDFQRTMERLSLSAVGSRHSIGYGFIPYLPISESPLPMTPPMTPPREPSPPTRMFTPPTRMATPPSRAISPPIQVTPPRGSPPLIRSYVPLPLELQATGVSYNEPITRYATPLSVPELPLPQTAEVLTRSTSTGSSGSGVPSLSSSLNSGSESDEDLPPLHRPSLAALERDSSDEELPPFNALLLLHNDKPGRKPVPRESMWRRASVAGAPPVPPRRRSETWRLELLRIVRGFDDVATAKEERDVVRKVGDPGLGEREALNVVRMFVDEIHARVRLGERYIGIGL